MEMRVLGRSGVRVSTFCLGAMMFGPWGNPDHDDCIRMMHTAFDAGINFVDTADVYSAGESEVIVGKGIADRRDDIVLATKFMGSMGEKPTRRGKAGRGNGTKAKPAGAPARFRVKTKKSRGSGRTVSKPRPPTRGG